MDGDARHRVRTAVTLGGFITAVALAAYSGSAEDVEWGSAEEELFAEWAEAWEASDAYDIARFYDADVAVGAAQDYRSLSLNTGNVGTTVGGWGRI